VRGILISCDVNASVIITDHPIDEPYYLGKHIISSRTEVKKVN
tara:strand:- start:6347 stop:6475 length:129 start_codon:yes stop_codon:yes gene_type:complete